MRFTNLKEAQDWEVKEYFAENLNLSNEQKRILSEVIEKSTFYFYKEKDYQPNFLLRLTILLFPIAYLLVLVGLPINFIITGKWGYGKVNWFLNWLNNLKM